MKPFSRLKDGDGTDVERLILGSARDDAPLPGARLKALAALGVAGAASTAGGAAHAATAALGGTGKAVGAATGFTLAKWFVIGSLAGAVTTGGVVVATTPGMFGPEPSAPVVRGVSDRSTAPAGAESRPSRTAAAPADPGAERVQQAAPGARQATEPATLRPRAPGGQEQEPPFEPAPGPQGTAFPVPGDTVAEEVAALDRVRSALASGSAEDALVRLGSYARRYPQGTLLPEAEVLRVRALVQLGRRREARAVVDSFVRVHPESPQATRLRALVGDSPAE